MIRACVVGYFAFHGASASRSRFDAHIGIAAAESLGVPPTLRREPAHSEIVQALNEMSGRFAESFRGDSRRGGARRGGYPPCMAVLTQRGRSVEQENTAA